MKIISIFVDSRVEVHEVLVNFYLFIPRPHVLNKSSPHLKDTGNQRVERVYVGWKLSLFRQIVHYRESMQCTHKLTRSWHGFAGDEGSVGYSFICRMSPSF